MVARPTTDLEATARCSRCSRLVAFMRSEQHGRPVPVHLKSVRVQQLLLAADLGAPGAALTTNGMPAHVSRSGEEQGYVLHAGACPELRRRRAAGEDTNGSGYVDLAAPGTEPLRPRSRPVLQTPDTGSCKKCPATVLWIRTAAKGKPVSLDPTPHTGVVLTKDQARELKGTAELVRGYNLRGEVVPIRVGYMPATPLEALETVYVTHFATCPAAASFRR